MATRLRVRELIEQKGITLSDLADRVGMTKQNLEKVVNEETTRYSRETLNDLAWALGVKVSDLFVGEPEMPARVRKLLELDQSRE